MAKDMVQLMNKLNFKKFFLAKNGKRKNKILALCVLDILDMYETTDRKFAKAYFQIIMSDPKKWMKSCLHKWF